MGWRALAASRLLASWGASRTRRATASQVTVAAVVGRAQGMGLATIHCACVRGVSASESLRQIAAVWCVGAEHGGAADKRVAGWDRACSSRGCTTFHVRAAELLLVRQHIKLRQDVSWSKVRVCDHFIWGGQLCHLCLCFVEWTRVGARVSVRIFST